MRTKILRLILLLTLTGCAMAGGVVDLGVVEINTDSSALIHDLSAPSQSLIYDYQQQLFFGPLSMMFDGGQTLLQVLDAQQGNQNPGTLAYNFPFVGGASGAYAQNTMVTGISQGTFLSFTEQTQSGMVYPGANGPGATINLDPTNPLLTLSTILGGMSTANFQAGGEQVTETTVTLPPLGTITTMSGVTTYVGEGEFFEWTDNGAASPASSVPEPAGFGLGLLGVGALWFFGKAKS